MCFSTSASFTAAAIIGTVGLFALSKARTFPMYLFALGPVFFAIQQALEGMVWMSLIQGDSGGLLNKVGVYGYLFFAGTFWPIAVPSALYFLEDDKKRKKFFYIIFMVAFLISSIFLIQLILQKQTSSIINNHIFYPLLALFNPADSEHTTIYFKFPNLLLTMGYLIAVTTPFFISSIKGMSYIGLVITISFIVAQFFYVLTFASVWCFFAAIISLCIYFIIINYNKTQSN